MQNVNIIKRHTKPNPQANIAGGEGFEWFYASAADRSAQIRTPITGVMGMLHILVARCMGLRTTVSDPDAARREIAKSLGKAMGEFKRATNDLKDSFSINDPPPTYRPMDSLPQNPAVTVNGDPAKPLESAADTDKNVSPETREKADHD